MLQCAGLRAHGAHRSVSIVFTAVPLSTDRETLAHHSADYRGLASSASLHRRGAHRRRGARHHPISGG
ncbi:MAG: hypothetical protein ACLUNO_07870 [Oscillospiraceae bacterium]